MAIGRTNAQGNKNFSFSYTGSFTLNGVEGTPSTKTVAKGDWVLRLLESGTLTVYHCGTKVDYYVLGGGGKGGKGVYNGGWLFSGSGGGGGYTKNVYGAKINYATVQSHTIPVTVGQSSEASSFCGTIAPAGENGTQRTTGDVGTDGLGGNGGSGGGGATAPTTWEWTIYGVAGGTDGNNGTTGKQGRDSTGATWGKTRAGGTGQLNNPDYGYNTYPFTDSSYGTNFGAGGKSGDCRNTTEGPTAGAANTGNGGGGGYARARESYYTCEGADGGSGIVIIRNART